MAEVNLTLSSENGENIALPNLQCQHRNELIFLRGIRGEENKQVRFHPHYRRRRPTGVGVAGIFGSTVFRPRGRSPVPDAVVRRTKTERSWTDWNVCIVRRSCLPDPVTSRHPSRRVTPSPPPLHRCVPVTYPIPPLENAQWSANSVRVYYMYIPEDPCRNSRQTKRSRVDGEYCRVNPRADLKNI